jgi:hypothetical protein
MVEQAQALIQALRPAQGFAVIGIDEYGGPDDQGPYSAGEFATLEEAMAVAKELKTQSGERMYVWGADGTVSDLDALDPISKGTLGLFDLMKGPYTGRGIRTGTPGNYTYAYPEEKNPRQKTSDDDAAQATRSIAAKKFGDVLRQFADLSEDENGNPLEPKRLTTEEQKQVRAGVMGLLDAYGLENWAEKENLPGKDQVINQGWTESTGEDDPGGRLYRLDTGALHVGRSDVIWAGKFHRDTDKPVKDRWGDLETKVFIHEAVHSTSPITMDAYSGSTQVLEEGTTELLARKIMREQFGVGKKSGVGKLPRGNKAGDAGQAYDSDIIHLRDAVMDMTGMSMNDAFEVLENAALSYRQKGAHSTRMEPGSWETSLGPMASFSEHLNTEIIAKLGADWSVDWNSVGQRSFMGKKDYTGQPKYYSVMDQYENRKDEPAVQGMSARDFHLYGVLDQYCWEAKKYL